MERHQVTDMLSRAAAEKQYAALSSLVAAFFLTLLKLITGIATGSLGILAEAAHSGLDMIAAVVTWTAVRLSHLPADREHHYGHGKFENLSALVETILLLITCGWIVSEAMERFLIGSRHVRPTVWAFVVMGTSLVVDITRARMLTRTAKKYGSRALEADALHFRTDIWSSSVVIAGLLSVKLNERLHQPMLEHADSAAAILVALIIVVVSLRLGKKAVDVLLDRAPEGLERQIEEAAMSVPDVLHCPRVRIREGGNTIFVDLTVAVGRNLPLERGHEIADAVEEQIYARVPDADVLVHVEPVEGEEEAVSERIRVIANTLEMNVHNIVIYELRKKLYVELHLEVDENLNLHHAHEMASRLERELRAQIPEIETINTHIESRAEKIAKGHDVTTKSGDLTSTIREIAETIPGLRDCHNITVRQVDRNLVVSLHCRFDGVTSIRQIHDASTMIEDRVKTALPSVERVLVHAEPT